MASNDHNRTTAGRRDGTIALICAGIAVGMVGASFAAVPLYKLYCQVTGFQGTTQRAEKGSDTVLDRVVRVHFDGNVAGNLPWTFEPVQPWMDVKIGENQLAFYRATNTSDHATTGTAVFNVTPDPVGPHFNKVQCFCFTEQRLEPGQSMEMPVSFFVDPKFATDEETTRLSELTLSYSFYPVKDPKKIEGQAAAPVKGSGG